MSHARSQIRQLFKSRLLGLPTTGLNVYAARVRALAPDNLPALKIGTQDEESHLAIQVRRQEFGRGRILARAVLVEIQANALGETCEDTLDAICAEVEYAIGRDPRLGGQVADTELLSTRTAFDDESEQKSGEATLTFRVTYHTREDDPETLIGE